MPVEPSAWKNLGAGCCQDLDSHRDETLFDGMSGSLASCKEHCARNPACGFVMYGWQDSTWCVAWPRKEGCSALDAGGDGHCGSRGDDGVRSYERKGGVSMV